MNPTLSDQPVFGILKEVSSSRGQADVDSEVEQRLRKIYILTEPETGEVRYVGVTWGTLRKRRGCHIREARRGHHSHKCHWTRQLLNQGLEPAIELLEVTEHWREREVFWIAHYRQLGARLTNLADGGKGPQGCRMPPEEKAKRSAAMKGRKFSPEHRAAISRGQMGREVAPATREKIAASQTGRCEAPEAIAKRSEALRGVAKSAEHREKIRTALKGRPATEQQLANLAPRQTPGWKQSDEARRRMSIDRQGRKRSPESIEKGRQSLIEYWARKRQIG
jgi:hypothetical protein